MTTQTISLTDERLSLEANEFVWNSEEDVSAHSYILPTVVARLKERGAERVLDLGCGNGSMTRAIQKAGFEVVGVDPSASGIEFAKMQSDGDFRRFSADERLPNDLIGKFDAVISTEVVEHLLLPRNLFARACEAMEGHRGLMIVSTPYHGYVKNLVIALCNGFDKHWHPLRDYGHVKFFSVDTLRRLFEEGGLTVDRIDLVGRFPLLAKSMILSGSIDQSSRQC